MSGPLKGVRIVELAGLGPTPFSTMMLAELGAEVVRVDRPGGGELLKGLADRDLFNRGKRSVAIDLKNPEGRDLALDLIGRADVLVEGFRPGVAERLGLGPDDCFARNSRLIYGRMTGWGQTGPLAPRAGHDLSYIAVTGALDAIGEPDGPPVVPLNLIGDFGGGALYMVSGVLAALYEREQSGQGQVIDAAIVDGVAHLMTAIHSLRLMGLHDQPRGRNLIDGGAPYYRVYRTRDDRYLAVAAMEPQFYQAFIDGVGVSIDPAAQEDRATWKRTIAMFKAAISKRTQDEWVRIFDGVDACVSPVLTVEQSARNAHLSSRGALEIRNGILQSSPAPRFSRTVSEPQPLPHSPGQDSRDVLVEWGIAHADDLLARSVAVQA